MDKKELQKETPTKEDAVCYKSKLLNKYFDSYEELVEEETAFRKANDEKVKLAEEKKTRAKEVEDALKEYEHAKIEASKIISKASQEASLLIKDAEKKYFNLRDAFAKDYNGYHMTYVNDNGKETVSFSDLVTDFFDLISL